MDRYLFQMQTTMVETIQYITMLNDNTSKTNKTNKYCCLVICPVMLLLAPSDRRVLVAPIHHKLLRQNYMGPHQSGHQIQVGYEKNHNFFTNISLYLGNDTRQGHDYCGSPTGTRTQYIELCYALSDC